MQVLQGVQVSFFAINGTFYLCYLQELRGKIIFSVLPPSYLLASLYSVQLQVAFLALWYFNWVRHVYHVCCAVHNDILNYRQKLNCNVIFFHFAVFNLRLIVSRFSSVLCFTSIIASSLQINGR